MRFLSRKILICLLAAMFFSAPLSFAQQRTERDLFGPKPVMENVFFNVVWGSLLGAVMGAASSVIAADVKTSPSGLRDTVFTGATAGGLIGLGVGLWLFSSGVTFDDRGTLLFSGRDPDGGVRTVAARRTPLFILETSTEGPMRIAGFRATVLDIRF